MKYEYLGNTLQSLAFRYTNQNNEINDFGVFNFPAQYDSEGHEIAPAKPYFTQYFSQFIDANGAFNNDQTGFELACISYLIEIGYVN